MIATSASTLPLRCILSWLLAQTTNTNYLNGKALARLTYGKLALVPVSAQRGDLLVPFTSVRNSKEFVFRTVPSMGDRASEDAETIKWVKPSLPVCEGDFIGDDSVLYCELVGE